MTAALTDSAMSPATALIGPNAVLQLLPVLDRAGGSALREAILAAAGMTEIPSGNTMIDETPVARLHRALRRQLPRFAADIAWEAGARTGDYILANRIPPLARRVLRVLPARPSSRLLSAAIARHAWTFAGSGRFRVVSHRPLVFEIEDNPLVRGEEGDHCLCQWHSAVFERLFTRLVSRRATVRETACCGAGAAACRFEISI